MLSLSTLGATIKQPSQEFSLVVGVLYLIKRESFSNTTFGYGLGCTIDMSNYISVKKRTESYTPMQKLYCSTKIKILSKCITFWTLEALKFHFSLKADSTKLRVSEDRRNSYHICPYRKLKQHQQYSKQTTQIRFPSSIAHNSLSAGSGKQSALCCRLKGVLEIRTVLLRPESCFSHVSSGAWTRELFLGISIV